VLEIDVHAERVPQRDSGLTRTEARTQTRAQQGKGAGAYAERVPQRDSGLTRTDKDGGKARRSRAA